MKNNNFLPEIMVYKATNFQQKGSESVFFYSNLKIADVPET